MRDDEKIKAAIQIVKNIIPDELYDFYEGSFENGWTIGWNSSSWALFAHPTLAEAYELAPVVSYTDGESFIDIDEYKELVASHKLPQKPRTPAFLITFSEIGLHNVKDSWPLPAIDHSLDSLGLGQREAVARAHSYFMLVTLESDEPRPAGDKSLVKSIFFADWPRQIKLSKAFWDSHKAYIHAGGKVFKRKENNEECLLEYYGSNDFKQDGKLIAAAKDSLQLASSHKTLFGSKVR